MKKRVGIPRALLYYDYYPVWKTFFEELGAETVLSDKTNKKIMNDGITYCINEACLPVKVFHGHIVNLKSRVDYLFIPRIRSVAKREYICPKFTGLPDMIRSSVPDLPPIIDTEVNLHKNSEHLKEAFIKTGLYITDDMKRIKNAYIKAMIENEKYKARLQNGNMPTQLLENYNVPKTKGLKIGVLGHIYNLYDHFVNNDLFKKLYESDAQIITPDMLTEEIIDINAQKLHKKVFWSFARKIMGATLHFAEQHNVDGIIYIMSFGCGIDSFIAELCERKLRRETNIPFYLLVVDEHSGEAGLNTRIEAFMDLLKWRKTNDSNLSTHG